MTHEQADNNAPDAGLPYGTEQRRSPMLAYILGVLYAVWFLVLLFLAATQIG